MATLAASSSDFEFGRAFRNTFDALRANFSVYLALSAIFVLVPNLIGAELLAQARQSGAIQGQVAATWAPLLETSLTGLFHYPAVGALYLGVVSHLRGREIGFAEGLRVGIANWAPLFVINLAVGVPMVFGLLLLIVPGVILYLTWIVAAPLKVIEGAPLSGVLARSSRLTEGHRAAILGFNLVLYLIIFAGSLALGFMFGFGWGFVRGFSKTMGHVVTTPYSAVAPFASAVGAWLALPVGSAGVAVIYAELRGVDFDAGRVAATFE